MNPHIAPGTCWPDGTLHALAEDWHRRVAEAGPRPRGAALHVAAYLHLRDADHNEVIEWFARWAQHEQGMMRNSARNIDPNHMSLSIEYTQREPGGDALYSVTTPSTRHIF